MEFNIRKWDNILKPENFTRDSYIKNMTQLFFGYLKNYSDELVKEVAYDLLRNEPQINRTFLKYIYELKEENINKLIRFGVYQDYQKKTPYNGRDYASVEREILNAWHQLERKLNEIEDYFQDGKNFKLEQERIAREAAQNAEQERRAREAAQKAEQERRAREVAQKAEQERRVREAAQKAEQERRAREAAQKAEQERRAREAAQKAEQERRAREEQEYRDRIRRESYSYIQQIRRELEEEEIKKQNERKAEELRKQKLEQEKREEIKRTEAKKKAEELRRQKEEQDIIEAKRKKEEKIKNEVNSIKQTNFSKDDSISCLIIEEALKCNELINDLDVYFVYEVIKLIEPSCKFNDIKKLEVLKCIIDQKRKGYSIKEVNSYLDYELPILNSFKLIKSQMSLDCSELTSFEIRRNYNKLIEENSLKSENNDVIRKLKEEIIELKRELEKYKSMEKSKRL